VNIVMERLRRMAASVRTRPVIFGAGLRRSSRRRRAATLQR
jgi:hypothetical protein